MTGSNIQARLNLIIRNDQMTEREKIRGVFLSLQNFYGDKTVSAAQLIKKELEGKQLIIIKKLWN